MTLHKISTFDEWNQFIEEHEHVLVKYTARWCGPCKAIGPFVEELALQHPDIFFCEIDIDNADEELISDVGSIPLFKSIIKKQIQGSLLGANKDKLTELIESFASSGTQ